MPRKLIKAIPIKAVSMNVMPIPRNGFGILEYSARRSRMAATAHIRHPGNHAAA